MDQKFIFLSGNVSEGFAAYGPYEIEEVFSKHDGEEGWVMELSYVADPSKTDLEV